MNREVFVYVNNDGFGHAVRNAATLRRLLDAQGQIGQRADAHGRGANPRAARGVSR